MNYPKSRDRELVVQELEKEVLIYDQRNNKFYSLNETSARVWRMCDGTTSVEQLHKRIAAEMKTPIGEEIIWLALDSLKQHDLLVRGESVKIDFSGLSRREVIRKIGLTSMVALPIVTGIVTPPAINAASAQRANNTPCSSSAQCQSGNCVTAPNTGGTCCVTGTTGNGRRDQAIGCSNSATCSDVNSCCNGSARAGTAVQFCTNRRQTTCYCN